MVVHATEESRCPATNLEVLATQYRRKQSFGMLTPRLGLTEQIVEAKHGQGRDHRG